jgi:hypothetical protein
MVCRALAPFPCTPISPAFGSEVACGPQRREGEVRSTRGRSLSARREVIWPGACPLLTRPAPTHLQDSGCAGVQARRRRAALSAAATACAIAARLLLLLLLLLLLTALPEACFEGVVQEHQRCKRVGG